MHHFLSTDSKAYQLMMLFYQLLVINLLFILSCVPLFTIGAAITALYSVTFKIIRHEEENVSVMYLKKFKAEFKKSTQIWLTYLGLILLFGLGYSAIRRLFQNRPEFFFLVLVFLSFVLLVTNYVFPLVAKFDNTATETVKNALFLALKHVPQSILLFLMFVGSTVLIPLYFPTWLFLWVGIGFALNAYLSSFVLETVFKKYVNVAKTISE